MKKISVLAVVFAVVSLYAFKPLADKLVSKDGHISFFSHTALEDITANNYKVVSTLDKTTGDVVFSVPMQSFEFEKAMMQKHFNSNKFLDTKKYPKAKFTGKITNLGKINFSKDGTYPAAVSGNLDIKGETKVINEDATVTVLGEKVTLDTKMKIVLADYGITFSGGKPSTNIAKDVEVSVKSVYAKQ
ncbi:YceI family protein [Arenibacter sp. TNZ]|jgi:polyisoprenoid-binding protein YceI|uniref:YceI family protein n=1 Tax=Arenibacter TaxID=178469 RepID=UPI000CD44532|nr:MULTISPECIES: YceI family protein [Arenibacter]MCM4171941.1 YceI family protein [Arenibacter sp. TNZ]